jgi:hypothetical protein
MKLKLEMVESVAVLTVSESVVMQDIQILKAGLAKLFSSNKKKVLLDLRPVAESTLTDEVRLQLALIASWATSQDAQVFNVSLLEGVGHTNEREAGVKLFDNPLARVTVSETQLTAQVRAAQKRKEEAEKKLNADPASAQLKELRRQNRELLRTIDGLEHSITRLMKGRKGPYASDSDEKKWKELQATVVGVLEQKKLMPAGAK